MKHRSSLAVVFALLSTLSLQPSTLYAQGTAFTYQGRLNNSGMPANGLYDFRFKLATDPLANNYVGGDSFATNTPVTNGLFLATIDFGPGIFAGSNYWLEVDVRTNNPGNTLTYTALAPLQAVTPTPYAVFAETASNMLGTVSSASLGGSYGNAVTFNNAGNSFSGDGSGLTGLVTSLTSGGGVSVSAASGAVTLGSTATSANTAGAIVSRDSSGNFSAGSVTLTGNLNLSGLPVTINSGGSSLLRADGNYNFFAGPNAGNLTTSGYGNTANGIYALYANTTGYNNTANGYAALYYNTTGNDNTANGYVALYANTTGYNNTANGYQALYANTTGNDNTANGVSVLFNNTTGSANTASGFQSLFDNMTGYNNTANGYQTLHANTTGYNNTANGFEALVANTTGNDNTANGVYALYANTTGYNNTASGYEALDYNRTGFDNTAIGYEALNDNQTGSYNVAEGYEALFNNNNGFDNTANGILALFYNTSGAYNTADGEGALYGNSTNSFNTAIGFNASLNSTGSNNISMGYLAGQNIFTGNNNIDIGNNGAPGENGIVRIGASGTQTATYLAGTVYANGVALTSDRNAKENFTAINVQAVLEKVATLPVTEWNYKTDSKDVLHLGPMAQDFAAAFKLDGADDKHISVVDEGGVALAAIQGLNQKLNEKDTQIQMLQQQNDSLAKQLNELATEVKLLAQSK